MILLLRNEAKTWYKAPCCCIVVDGCAVRDMWIPLVAEKIFIQLDLRDERWILERKLAGRVATVLGREMLKIGGPGFKPTVVGFMTHTQSQRQVFGNGAGGGGDNLVPPVSSMLRLHTACSAQKTHPSCNPCLVHTV